MPERGFLAKQDEPLIGIVLDEEGDQVVHYFAHEQDADRVLTESATGVASDLVGAWSDLDWHEMAQELDRIRHESSPSAPLDL